ncbi:YheC/YheD family protein [Cohnella nanjingensis]|uniref:YheC/YheD family protein n=1 Tax=Cohnella nanjingensis TaxID=1387779 RepID=A0A7X0RRH7_9BACL|nr:YheC/YheD family protein [Cohnella nanjingensis]MBB6670939.1 YheC/YheD family protein [Cohnella nanjingensis]
MHHGSGRMLASKWVKTAALLSNRQIAEHIPATRILSPGNLRGMLALYGMVVIKPIRGAGGHGVIKVTKHRSRYSAKYMTRTRTFGSFGALYRHLGRIRRRRVYLIQKGIHLATIGGRPIDYRVKFVKVGARWQFRSMVGRLARRGLFVTNLCRGGSQLTAAQGISRSLSPRLVGVKKRQMRHLTHVATGILERRFPGIGQLGYDYGIDRRGHIWILEVNTRPQ